MEACRHGQDKLLKFKLSIRGRTVTYVTLDITWGWSECLKTADLLQFSCTNISKVYRERSENSKIQGAAILVDAMSGGECPSLQKSISERTSNQMLYKSRRAQWTLKTAKVWTSLTKLDYRNLGEKKRFERENCVSGTGDPHHGSTAYKYAASDVTLSCQNGSKSRRNDSSTLWSQCMKN